MTTSVAHYRILDRLGEGGLGDVFRARDTRVGRTVALKLLPAGLLDDRARRERFRADAAAAAALSHPNIATLFDVGEDQGRWFLAYEFVSGETLRQQMAGRAMHPRHALEIAIQLADALAEAHAHDVLHRDLRPENIVITAKGSSKLLDTGMSAWTKGGAARQHIAASASSSSGPAAEAIAAYMSPEQITGGEVDARTDIFSLGVIVYEMLTARAPFATATAAGTAPNVTARVPRPSEGAAVELPRELDSTLAKALAKDLASRQQSAVSFAAELRSIAAIVDVRAGEAVPSSSMLPIDDEASGAARWWALAAVLGGLALAVWLWFR